MDFVKSKEIISVLEKIDIEQKKTIIAVLDVAEHIEKGSKEFYEKEVKKTKGTELEAFFSFLVKEEEEHLKKILELKKMLKVGKAKKIVLEGHRPPNIHNTPAGKDETTALLYSLWREKKAADFYAGAAVRTEGPVRDLFSDLARFEIGHVAMFEQLIEDLNTSSDLMLG